MVKINVKEARSELSHLLDLVEDGEEVVILRRGKEVACLLPPSSRRKPLPSLKDFRKSIRVKGKPLSRVVVDAREKERY